MVMSMSDHWESVFETKDTSQVSWYQEVPKLSLELVLKHVENPFASVIDVGGGDSRLLDGLLEHKFQNLSLLDISRAALSATKNRLGERVRYIKTDVTQWRPDSRYDLVHDRAAFHFLTDLKDQESYAENMYQALNDSGTLIIGTFSKNGDSKRCSALDICQHDAQSIENIFRKFDLVENFEDIHQTPSGNEQLFSWHILKKK